MSYLTPDPQRPAPWELDRSEYRELAQRWQHRAESAEAELSRYRAETWTDHDGTVRTIVGTRAELARKLYDENERAGRAEIQARSNLDYARREGARARSWERAAESWDRETDELAARAERAEARAAAWWEAAKTYCRSLNLAWHDIEAAEARAEDNAEQWQKATYRNGHRYEEAAKDRDAWREMALANAARMAEMGEEIRALQTKLSIARGLIDVATGNVDALVWVTEEDRVPFERRTERKPRAFRDNDGDVWVETSPGKFTADWGYDTGTPDLSEWFKDEALEDVERAHGPLTEITEG